MKFNKALIIIGAILAAAGLAGVCAGLFATSAMIVSFGIRTLSTISTISYGALGAGVLMVGTGVAVPLIKNAQKMSGTRQLEEKRKSKERELSEYAKDSLNPLKTRSRLEQLKENNSQLTGIVDTCLRQMDRIDVYQDRQKSLLDANEAIYLEDTIEVLDESERRMCRNFRNIINCCILIENTNSGTEELDSKIINDSLSDNEEELAGVSTLLKYSVAYINNYNRNGVQDRSELDAWLKIMKASMGEK